MNTPPFRFIIPATRSPRRQTLALHLLISFVLFAAGLFCLVLYWYTGISPNFKMAINAFGVFGGLCFLGGIAIYILSISVVRRERFSGLLRVVELGLLAVGTFLFYYNGWDIPAMLFLLLLILATAAALFEKKAPSGTVIEVSDAGVQKRSGLQNTLLPWSRLRQLLYRRGILTIDCLDNRLQQYTVSGMQIDKEAFEAYCANQIEKAIPQRGKADW